MRVALYARVSTRDKDQNPETQLGPLRSALGVDDDLVGEFVDRASAADLRGRRRWRELLTLVDQRKVDLLLFWRLDRIARSVPDAADILKRLRAGGCGLRSLQEPWLDTTTAFGEALYYITVVYAQLERAALAERVKAGMERARAEGKAIGRPPRAAIEQHRRWPEVRDLVLGGVVTLREGARLLKVRQSDFAAALVTLRKGGPAQRPSTELTEAS
jgi:DNA invertase Pin-like site-specific DNA recombinase